MGSSSSHHGCSFPFGCPPYWRLLRLPVSPSSGAVRDRVAAQSWELRDSQLFLVTRNYEDGTGETLAGRVSGFEIGTAEDTDEDYATGYHYDSLGRLERVTGPGLPAYGVQYTRLMESSNPTSDMVESLEYKSDVGTVLASTTRGYQEDRDLLASVQNVVQGTPEVTVSKYEYQLDPLGRRTSVVQTGSAFVQDHLWKWSYNDRSELTGANRHEGTQLEEPLLGDQMTPGEYTYNYDPIGNRLMHRVDNDASRRWYCANSVNQYTAIDDEASTCPTPGTPTQRLEYDADGNLTAISAAAGDGPMLVSAASVRTHGAVGDFAIPLPLAAGADAGVECRAGGPTRIVLQFTEAVTLSGSNVDLSSGTCVGVAPLGNHAYEVQLSGADENACLTLTLVNVAGASSSQRLVGINQVRVVVLKGDVDASGLVETADLTAIQGQNQQPVTAGNFRCDVNANGEINILDLVAANDNRSASASCTLPEVPLHWQLSWDAENRLVAVAPAVPAAGDKKVVFTYDYMNRRVQKRVFAWNATLNGGTGDWEANPEVYQRFVYDQWNVVLVLDGPNRTIT
ncbi:MAG: hypothetical protein GXY55_18900, partial [Phycisphaerae bacterium]|nr:hypothetical protein [Phycisphaerae bacterium]